ncbi:hypothetical protein H1R20_g2509, partial [Candolleomyces eurysporus]
MVFLSLRFLALWAFCSASVVYSHVTPGRRDGFGKPSQLFNRNLPTPTGGASKAAETFYVRAAPPVNSGVTIPFDSIPIVASDDAPSDDEPEDQDQDDDDDENTFIVDDTILSRRQIDTSQLTGILPAAAAPILSGTGNPTGLVGNTLLPMLQNAGAPGPPAPPTPPARRHLKKASLTKRQLADSDLDGPFGIGSGGDDDTYRVSIAARRSTPMAKAKRNDSNAAQDVNQGISDGKTTVDDAVDTNTNRIAAVTGPGSVSRGASYVRRQDSDAPQDVSQDTDDGQTTAIDALTSSVASRIISASR